MVSHLFGCLFIYSSAVLIYAKQSLSRSDQMEPFPTNPHLQFHDFIADPHFHQFVDLIRGEPVFNVDLDLDLVNGCFAHHGLSTSHEFGIGPDQIDELDPSSVFEELVSFDGGEMRAKLDDNEVDDSSAAVTMATKDTKLDRSRTLMAERRRRGRMKEKLHNLRSLVPNITRMDKASIVGDAVSYVQELQMQTKKLRSEIAALEASIAGPESYHRLTENPRKKLQAPITQNLIVPKQIIDQMDVFQVEERGFYVRLASERRRGVAMALYKVLESLTSFNLQSSNLAMASERFVLTATMNVRDGEKDVNLPNLKLWVAEALLDQGFELRPLH